MARYRSRPTEVDAILWTGDNIGAVTEFVGFRARVALAPDGGLQIKAGPDGQSGFVNLPLGNWLLAWPDDRTDLWPVDPQRFDARYDPVP